MLIKSRDRGGIDVLNKRIELLERALHAHGEEAAAAATPNVIRSQSNGSMKAEPSRGQPPSSRRENVDVDAARNAEGVCALQQAPIAEHLDN